MNLTTKGDLVLAALRKLGVASNATLTDVEPQSMEDGVNDLEMMMAEWLGGDDSPGISEWKGLPLDMRLINFRAIIG